MSFYHFASFYRISRLLMTAGVLMIASPAVAAETSGSTYDFTFHALVGDASLPLAAYRGKVILIVNTASQCGFTGQYAGLEKLYNTYKDKGLVIVGIPSDDFGHQEPGSNQEIAHFCALNFGVSFPMASKENVIGDNAHPFYKWAHEELGAISTPMWNFHKYLIGRDGKLIDYFISTTAPDNKRLTDAIENALNAPVSPEENENGKEK